tara:strand:+ start:4659 stop:5321 length:663 start_codon:yes stop_codon:yes gene_type:complete
VLKKLGNYRIFQVIAIAAITGLIAGCTPGDPFRSTGTYPIDIFQEMHYNQTYKAQEPPRLLPPKNSYPISGGYIRVADIENIDLLSNPLNGTPNIIRRGALVYKQNCSTCHGLTAQGDGPTGNILTTYNVTQPPAFGDGDGVIVIRQTGQTELKPGKAYQSIAAGYGYMPAFEGLLSPDDIWAVIALIDSSTAVRNSALTNVNKTSEVERSLELLKFRQN